MGLNIRGRSFLTLLDFTPDEINYLLDLASEFKRMKNNGIEHKWLTDKQIVLLFEKTSTRTRCAFEVGARDLGMGVTFLDSGSSQMGKKESLADTAKVLGRMFDGIEYRGFKQSVVEDLARYSGVPVWNGLTDQFHPTQMLADIMTAREEFGDMRGRKLTFFGDARNNVANSLMVVCAKLGMHFCACGPKELMPEDWLIEKCQAVAAETGAQADRCDVADEAAVRAAFSQLPGADVLINNAGIADYDLITVITPARWRRLFAVNVDGAFYCIRAALPHMLQQQSGCIINVSSMWGQVGASCEAAYSATKGAILALTKALAQELGPSGIRVNAVAPGVIRTDMCASVDPAVMEDLRQQTPIGRLGTPEDIAQAMLYLADAPFLTGQTLPLNGGFVIT